MCMPTKDKKTLNWAVLKIFIDTAVQTSYMIKAVYIAMLKPRILLNDWYHDFEHAFNHVLKDIWTEKSSSESFCESKEPSFAFACLCLQSSEFHEFSLMCFFRRLRVKMGLWTKNDNACSNRIHLWPYYCAVSTVWGGLQ